MNNKKNIIWLIAYLFCLAILFTADTYISLCSECTVSPNNSPNIDIKKLTYLSILILIGIFCCFWSKLLQFINNNEK